ncbi:hypothetical protein BDU57DRAFT_518836 [Ampelomyces quisqualis]|uniref:Uncharacterized protein n=1 Tax=Ampelomyces quisqualis TaxID=50730 RepID=A0A6A5QJY0_AMPQU|nr:hypothetical protein BDU57DRAFT_518836 [Ampelomyces quisqualis]
MTYRPPGPISVCLQTQDKLLSTTARASLSSCHLPAPRAFRMRNNVHAPGRPCSSSASTMLWSTFKQEPSRHRDFAASIVADQVWALAPVPLAIAAQSRCCGHESASIGRAYAHLLLSLLHPSSQVDLSIYHQDPFCGLVDYRHAQPCLECLTADPMYQVAGGITHPSLQPTRLRE